MAGPPTIEALIADVLSEALEKARERSIAAAGQFDAVAQGLRRVVIMGSAYLGKLALSGAAGAGLNVVAFADNNPSLWGTVSEGIPIMSPADAVSKYNDDAFFVVAIYNGTPIRAQLKNFGCRRVVPYPLFFWRFSQFMSGEDRLELPHRILASTEAMRKGFCLLSDTSSRVEFAAQVQWRCTLDYTCLPPPEQPSDMYFGSDIIGLKSDEVVVDCGAFDGDSIGMFLNKTGRSFRHIYALEPDSKNRVGLELYRSSLSDAEAIRISILPFGASDHSGTVGFDAAGTVGSRIVSAGSGGTIECRRLDDLLDGPPPTFIKMDIEGAEPEAIKGATRTIRDSRPILAACAYHKCEHLWTLPVLLKEALPDYQIFLRRYAEECWETVYYAIPPERVIQK